MKNLKLHVEDRTKNFQIINQTPYAFGHQIPITFSKCNIILLSNKIKMEKWSGLKYLHYYSFKLLNDGVYTKTKNASAFNNDKDFLRNYIIRISYIIFVSFEYWIRYWRVDTENCVEEKEATSHDEFYDKLRAQVFKLLLSCKSDSILKFGCDILIEGDWYSNLYQIIP